MWVSTVGYVFTWAFFFFTLTTISSLYGVTVINDPNITLSIPAQPGLLDFILFPINVVFTFIALATVSSSFAILVPLLLAVSIGMVWAFAILIRGGGN